jgi:uroporphyrinogen-III synthase
VYAAGSRAAALVAALREREALAGARVLVPRAERVREEVGAALAAAGALVDEVAVYRTEPEAVDPEQLARETARCDALTFASPSAVRQFAAVLGGDAPRLARPAVKLAIGRATAEALAEAGLPADVVAETPSAEGVVAALAGVFARRAQEEPS